MYSMIHVYVHGCVDVLMVHVIQYLDGHFGPIIQWFASSLCGVTGHTHHLVHSLVSDAKPIVAFGFNQLIRFST